MEIMKKTTLLIDIDGVLFGEYDGYYQLRPGVSSFFVWANARGFQTEFLTCWSWARVQTLLESLYIDRRSLNIGYRLWYNLKTDGLQPEEDFYIVDDNLVGPEVEQLEKWDKLNRYIKVDRTGPDELVEVKRKLIEMLKDK